MKKYENYKKVDLPYLTKIPEHWNIRRNKNLFKRKKVTVGSDFNDYQLLSLTTKGLREKSINDFNGKLPESYETYQKVEVGDLIMCLFDLDCSAVFAGLSKYDGMITSAYLKLKCQEAVCPEYYNYWFSCLFQNRVYKIYSKSIRFTVSNSDFGLIESVYPPVKEQEKIAAFLDYKISRIDKAIELEEKKKEKIKNLKQSIISDAVTKGLNPDVPMKDSGVDWIGEIPEHWELRKIKYVFNERSEKGYPEERLLASTQNHGVVPKELYENRTVIAMKGLENLKFVKVGDFVISLRSFEGGIEYAYYKGIISPAYTVIYIKKYLTEEYFRFLGKSFKFIHLLQLCVTGIREGQNINYNLLKTKKIPVPSMNEQQQIVSYLDKKTSEIDTYISKIDNKIEKLKSLKQSLISEVVTGQIDVRDFEIPEEV